MRTMQMRALRVKKNKNGDLKQNCFALICLFKQEWRFNLFGSNMFVQIRIEISTKLFCSDIFKQEFRSHQSSPR